MLNKPSFAIKVAEIFDLLKTNYENIGVLSRPVSKSFDNDLPQSLGSYYEIIIKNVVVLLEDKQQKYANLIKNCVRLQQ